MHNTIAVKLFSSHRVLTFAKQQFEYFYSNLHYRMQQNNVVIGTYEQLKASSDQYFNTIASSLTEAKYSDEFVIEQTTDCIYLIGVTPRAALFAVYHYLENEFGFKWALPHTINENLNKKNQYDLEKQYHFKPLMERRGIVVETIDDINFMQSLVDWLAKNKINELFLTFTLYDKIKSYIDDMLLDRGIDLTLGGHSASFFMTQLKADKTADHPYTAKRQLDYADNSWQPSFIDQVVDYCRNITSLKRLSLWPEDIKHQSTANFLAQYTSFTANLRATFIAKQIEVEVEHIAYNAGLAWDMLELSDTTLIPSVHTLFAYWGRDYSHDFNNEHNESDFRGYNALVDWHKKTSEINNNLTVFEYYSDHFMQSPLFGMLSQRIDKDIKHYVSMGINSITNLIVPARVEHYPYQWNQYFNSFIFARTLWGENVDHCVDYYVSHFPPQLQQIYKQWLFDSERFIAILTKWNVPLFPARAVDAEKVLVISDEHKALLIEQMQQIIDLVESYLNKPEIIYSQPFEAVLKHFHAYALDVHKQWQMK